MNRNLCVTVLLALVTAGSVSCGGDSLSPDAKVTVGAYALELVAGRPLPYTFTTTPCTGLADSGVLQLKTDGSYDVTIAGHTVCANAPGSAVTFGERGTWDVADGNLKLTHDGNNVLHLSNALVLDDNVITMMMDMPSGSSSAPSTHVATTWQRQ